MIFLNPTYTPAHAFLPPGREPMIFHRRMPGYVPTPLHQLAALADELGVRQVYVKDESARLGLPAFKILGAAWAIYRWLCDEFGDAAENATLEELASLAKKKNVALFAATDGNHGRAVARMAKLLGVPARVYVPIRTVPSRIKGIESEGAHVTIVDGTYDAAVKRAAADAERDAGVLIQDNGWEGYEEIPRRIIEGYSTLLWEIDDALQEVAEEDPTHVIVQIGVGSFADAVVRHYCGRVPAVQIIGVEPLTAACTLESVKAGKLLTISGPHTSIMAGMNCDSPSLVSFPVMQAGIRAFVAIRDELCKEAMRLYARNGVIAGETGAAGLGALLELRDATRERELLGINHSSRILLIVTEGITDPVSYHSIVGVP